MVRRVTKVVGMIIPDSGNGFFVDLAQQFQRELTGERCAVVIMSSDGSNRRESEHLRVLREMGVDGVVFIGAQFNMNIYEELQNLDLPLLVLDREIPVKDSADFVMLDNEQAVRLAVNHLVELGHERLAHIEGAQRTEPGKLRKEAFAEACDRAGVTAECITGDFTYVAGRRAAERLLAYPEGGRPTAIVAGNDLAAIGAIQYLLEHGLRIPAEMSVVGFDDIEMSSWIYPALTSIRQDRERLAVVGARLLSSRMAHESVYPGTPFDSRREVVEPELIVRDSSGPPPGRIPES